jgi:hypothetical protein
MNHPSTSDNVRRSCRRSVIKIERPDTGLALGEHTEKVLAELGLHPAP